MPEHRFIRLNESRSILIIIKSELSYFAIELNPKDQNDTRFTE